MIADLRKRLKAGETIHARVPETGRLFDIQPAYSKLFSFPLGYSILVDGVVQPGYKGILFDPERDDDWALYLDEVIEQSEVA